MLYTFDRNDSLKQTIKQEPANDDDDTPGPLSELQSSWQVHGDQYLSREYVDKWAMNVLQDMMGDKLSTVSIFLNLHIYPTDEICLVVTTTCVLTNGKI